MNKDPIERLLEMAEDLNDAMTSPPQELPVDVVAKLNQRLFGRPLENQALTPDQIDLVLLMLIRRRSSTASELIEALNKENVRFGENDGAIFRLLQNLERQDYVKAALQERATQRLQVYSLTDDGIALVEGVTAKEPHLLSIVDRVALGLNPAG